MFSGKRWHVALIVVTVIILVGMVAISSVVDQRVQNDNHFGTALHELLLSVDPTPASTLPPTVEGLNASDAAMQEAAPTSNVAP